MTTEQVATISARATAFTVVCDRCAADGHDEAGAGPGWAGASFAGSLDLDLDGGAFLCRRGHAVQVIRMRPAARTSSSFAA